MPGPVETRLPRRLPRVVIQLLNLLKILPRLEVNYDLPQPF
jgi:hypothetical protein